ncbi:MAG: bile acid:sodium symporter family protein, partial [Bacteroidales bacterium]|nr:bile acid:sodium symporter family protein [Bacteroidales bacterium]
LNFAIYGGWFTKILQSGNASGLLRPLEIDPMEMFKAVLILLGIPLLLGMVFNAKFPETTMKLKKPMQILSIILFLGMVFVLFKKNYDFFLAHIQYIFLLVLVHNGLAFFTGYSFASITRRSKFDRRAITIETGIQNSGLGLVLLFNPKIFPADLELGGMAFITAWWGIWHIISGLSLSGILSFIPLREKTA